MSDHATERIHVGEAFAQAVCCEDWLAIYPLLSESARAGFSAMASAKWLTEKFSWKTLERALSEAWKQETGESMDSNELDPPERFEVYESEGRHQYSPQPVFRCGLTQPPATQKAAWIMIDFLPGEDSGNDHCYRCYLCMVNDFGKEKVAGFLVEPITD